MYCAIDFGTSNSAIGVPGAEGQITLVELEPGHRTMPTAVFYFADAAAGAARATTPPRAFGRAALAAYVDGFDGRLMRSMKSILGRRPQWAVAAASSTAMWWPAACTI